MKNNKLTRRQFIGLSAAFGSFSLVPGLFWNRVKGNFYKTLPDISVIESTNYYDGTIEAINALGGIQKFVSKGSKVGLLINGKFSNEGTFTNPDISLAVLKLCYEAGANTFVMFGFNNEDYWSRSKHYESHLDILKKISYSSGYKNIAVDKGKTLREAEMSEELPDLDVLINLPISKHHNAANLTCCLKNMMGLCAHTTNAFFHTETGQRGPTDSNRLAQCVA